MADVDGVEVHRVVCEYHPEMMARFVFLTGGVIDEATESYVEQSGVQVLSKPVRRAEFEKTIAAVGGS